MAPTTTPRVRRSATPTLRVNKRSEIPIHRQLVEQVIVLIVTGHFQPGENLPGVRQLARKNGIHYNTVSRAYRQLADDGWLVSQRGRPSKIRSPGAVTPPRDIDGLLDVTIRLAQECGYSSEQLRKRLMERLAHQPDHILVVSTDAGMAELIRSELGPQFACRVEACVIQTLATTPHLALGALVVYLQGGTPFVEPALPEACRFVTVPISDPNEPVQMIREMQEPSIIGLASISPLFLQRGSGMLAPVLGDRHTLQTYLLEGSKSRTLRSADFVLCDSVAYGRVKAKNRYEYRLIAPKSIDEIRDALGLA